MKLLDWLLTPAKSGMEHAVSSAIELAILGLGGLILTFVLARIPGFTDTFWASCRDRRLDHLLGHAAQI